MSTITNYKKLPKDVSTRDDLDYAFLKQLGIEYIQSMGGGLWSDMNDHDPGVTMLEMLAYAITDLGARIDLPIETILASKDDIELRNQFYRAEEILPSCPVNQLDYRKFFIDIEGVRNCWILPKDQLLYADCANNKLSHTAFDVTNLNQTSFGLQGLNCVLVDYEDDANETLVNQLIIDRYHQHRNLCEDLVEIKKIKEKPVSVCTTIELEKSADEDVVHAHILDAINTYFAMEIKRYSLKQMREKGYRMDEIFEGPLLNNGFIDTEELSQSELRSEVRLSDIINLIMSVEGVKSISEITIQGCGNNTDGSDWLICIEALCKPILAPTLDQPDPIGDCTLRSFFNYKKDVMPVVYNSTKVDLILQEIEDARNTENALAMIDMFPSVKKGQILEIGETTTIQNDFPETYGLGPYGLPATAGTQRRAQAKQLKAYLLFFDQILATYFAHLDKVKDLFAMNSGNAPTYFTQAVKDLKGMDELLTNYPTNDDALLSTYLIGDPLDDKIARRNEILDHLLSRFAENFGEYAFILTQLYGTSAEEMLIQTKEEFLAEYVDLSSRRGKGFNYKGDVWDTENVSGVQKRVARLSGIEDYSRRNLVASIPWLNETGGMVEWYIESAPSQIELTSDDSFNSFCEAHENRLMAVDLLNASDPLELQNQFSLGVSDGQIIENVQITISGTDYSFSVIDPDSGAIFAISPVYASDTDLLAAILALKLFLELPQTVELLNPPVAEEGMFLVEHILLLPDISITNEAAFLPICVDDCQDTCGLDPYSFRASIILSGTPERFANLDFRNYMDKLIREELPSHILPRICWVDDCQLDEFQQKYRVFLEEKNAGIVTESTLIEFIDIFTELHTIYPGGRLHDCETEDLTGKIILGRSNL